MTTKHITLDLQYPQSLLRELPPTHVEQTVNALANELEEKIMCTSSIADRTLYRLPGSPLTSPSHSASTNDLSVKAIETNLNLAPVVNARHTRRERFRTSPEGNTSGFDITAIINERTDKIPISDLMQKSLPSVPCRKICSLPSWTSSRCCMMFPVIFSIVKL